MTDLSRTETLVANERIKNISGVLTNLGTALVATAAGRWFLGGWDLYVGVWSVVAGLMVWSGYHVLTLLEAEN